MKTKSVTLEFTVGVFIIIGVLCLGYLSIQLAKKEIFDTGNYTVHAFFSNISGLSPGAPVEIAGVEVGRVKKITLDDYDAHVQIIIQEEIQLQMDVIASIKTKGLFGEKYVEIVPGGDEEIIEENGKIRYTEPAVDFEGLISKFIHGKI